MCRGAQYGNPYSANCRRQLLNRTHSPNSGPKQAEIYFVSFGAGVDGRRREFLKGRIKAEYVNSGTIAVGGNAQPANVSYSGRAQEEQSWRYRVDFDGSLDRLAVRAKHANYRGAKGRGFREKEIDLSRADEEKGGRVRGAGAVGDPDASVS